MSSGKINTASSIVSSLKHENEPPSTNLPPECGIAFVNGEAHFLDWRKPEDVERKPLSKGIPPRQFHTTSSNGCGSPSFSKSSQQKGRRRQRPGQEKVEALHSKVQETLLNAKKKEVGQELDLKRSAFKEVTVLKTWPLQDRAFAHLHHLMKEHLHLEENGTDSGFSQPLENKEEGASSSSTAQSTDSCQSAEEPKRLHRDASISPSKSARKALFKEEFLKERALPKVSAGTDNAFGNALWCMEPRIFSTERSKTGKRKYVVGHLGRIIDQYWRRTDL